MPLFNLFQPHGEDAAHTNFDSPQLFLLAICCDDAILDTFVF